MNFGKKLKESLIWKGITQKELAIMLNVGKSTISMWISNKNSPNLETFYRICIILKETPNYFLGFED